MTESAPGPAGFSWQQGVALLVGAFYLVFGVVGFFFVRDLSTAVTGQAVDSLLGIDLNGAQNFLHVALGVLGLLMSTKHRTARRYGVVLAVVGVALFVLGMISLVRPDLNVLDLNWPGNVLHLLTALLGLATAVRARSSARS
jgi:hypothetical protein